MADDSTEIKLPSRDGTSQAARVLTHLDPAGLGIDERSTRDLLAFSQEYVKKLRYYNDNNEHAGDWFGFFAGRSPEDIVDFLARPEDFPQAQYRRPHFVLFLAWLQLLGKARDALNGLTRRHLDFYYRDVLQLTPRPAQPDRAFVLFGLAPGADPVEIPAGAPLAAGRDSTGRDRTYVTEHKLVVNHAKVAHLASVFRDEIRPEKTIMVPIPETITGEPKLSNRTFTVPASWHLYAYKDATTVVTSDPAVLRAGEAPRWKTFGAPPIPPKPPSPDDPAAAALGLAIASPLLALSGGDRRIDLTLTFSNYRDTQRLDKDTQWLGKDTPFKVEVSTAKGWIEPKPDAVNIEEKVGTTGEPAGSLTFTLTFRADAAPLDAPARDERLGDCPWPVVRITLRRYRADNQFTTSYSSFRELQLTQVALASTVGIDALKSNIGSVGVPLAPLVLENDNGTLDGKRPFEPFGTAPAPGATLSLSHADLLHKPLTSLKLHLAWMGTPAKFVEHYKGYLHPPPPPPFALGSFKVKVSQVTNGVPSGASPEKALFTADRSSTSTHESAIPISDIAETWKTNAPANLAPLDPLVTAWPRYLRLELQPPGFLHQEYPALVAQKTLQLAAAIAKDPKSVTASEFQVNPPYTPKLKSLGLSFTAGRAIPIDKYERGSGPDRIFHLHPFGYTEAPTEQKAFPFLPSYYNEGELYIGIAGLWPPQSLSVLLRMAEGSADPGMKPKWMAKSDTDLRMADATDSKATPHEGVAWNYLDADGWQPLPAGGILRDDTRGLINSGIIEFALPEASPDTRLPRGFYWLRAAVTSGAAGVCDMVAIDTQAAAARYADAGGAPDHYATPLPASSITALGEALPGITSVRQPYTSFSARMAEDASGFYTAASERLRHKQRAVTLWDYERLVLREFPQVYKAKCLPAQSDAPGQVRMVVIPDIRGRSLNDPFEPKVSARVLKDIEDFLRPLMPEYASLEAINAVYFRVGVWVAVRFEDVSNPGLNRRRLNDDLNRYLAPWAYDEGADIIIGQSIYANSIMAFIESRSYVRFAGSIRLFLRTKSSFDPQSRSPEALKEGYSVSCGDNAAAVLVGAPRHIFYLVETLPSDRRVNDIAGRFQPNWK